MIVMRKGPPPAGFRNWQLRLLAHRVVELGIVDSISHETVEQTRKTGIAGSKVQNWVVPPEADAEFAAAMDEVIETYARSYDPAQPVVRVEKHLVQLVEGARCKLKSVYPKIKI